MRFFASVSSDLRLFPGDYSHIYEGEWSQVVFNRRTPSLIRQSGDANHAPSEASSLPSVKSGRRKTFFFMG